MSYGACLRNANDSVFRYITVYSQPRQGFGPLLLRQASSTTSTAPLVAADYMANWPWLMASTLIRREQIFALYCLSQAARQVPSGLLGNSLGHVLCISIVFGAFSRLWLLLLQSASVSGCCNA